MRPSSSSNSPKVACQGRRSLLSAMRVFAIATDAEPERRTMPMPPRPDGVEIAAIVSSSFKNGLPTRFLSGGGGRDGDRRSCFHYEDAGFRLCLLRRVAGRRKRGGDRPCGNGPVAEAGGRAKTACPPDRSLRAGKAPNRRSRCATRARCAVRYEATRRSRLFIGLKRNGVPVCLTFSAAALALIRNSSMRSAR